MASTEGLTRILEVFSETEMRLRDAASKKILIEVALLKAIEARNAVSLDTVLNQLQSLRGGTPEPVVATPAGARSLAAKARLFSADATALDPIPASSEAESAVSEIVQPVA